MAEITSVVCDVHYRSKHPATHMAVPVDMCDRAFAIHKAATGKDEEYAPLVSMRALAASDNEAVLQEIIDNPNYGRAEYADNLGWAAKRVSYALNRLSKQGLVKAKGKAQASTWSATAAGLREANAS